MGDEPETRTLSEGDPAVFTPPYYGPALGSCWRRITPSDIG